MYSPVSSKMTSPAVIAALVQPAKTAPMPTRANAPVCPASEGKTAPAASPKAAPVVAPITSEGANTPPEPPMPMVRLVAGIFAAARSSRNLNDVVNGS
ncbi:hypothetical protein GCM10009849_25060 [Sinomonas flava]|uniref:Uncharacterized protein n=1 Tax=Sinomonas flava TaxID=496857 RepID=A0ABN3BWI4_9MICC